MLPRIGDEDKYDIRIFKSHRWPGTANLEYSALGRLCETWKTYVKHSFQVSEGVTLPTVTIYMVKEVIKQSSWLVLRCRRLRFRLIPAGLSIIVGLSIPADWITPVVSTMTHGGVTPAVVSTAVPTMRHGKDPGFAELPILVVSKSPFNHVNDPLLTMSEPNMISSCIT